MTDKEIDKLESGVVMDLMIDSMFVTTSLYNDKDRQVPNFSWDPRPCLDALDRFNGWLGGHHPKDGKYIYWVDIHHGVRSNHTTTEFHGEGATFCLAACRAMLRLRESKPCGDPQIGEEK